jgi:ribosome recycling factor
MVSYYGASTSLKSMATVSTPDSQTVAIQPFDKTAIKDIERAIQTSDIGIMPSNDGNVIRLNVPALTEDRRKELSKVVSKLGEEGKVRVRDRLKKQKCCCGGPYFTNCVNFTANSHH